MTDYYIKKGNKYVKANPYHGLGISVSMMGSVRYALGCDSYSPGCVMDFFKTNWIGFEKKTRLLTMRDVMEWLGDRHNWVVAGTTDSAWPDEWRKFLRWCFAQDAEEAKAAAQANVCLRDRLQDVDEFFKALG